MCSRFYSDRRANPLNSLAPSLALADIPLSAQCPRNRFITCSSGSLPGVGSIHLSLGRGALSKLITDKATDVDTNLTFRLLAGMRRNTTAACHILLTLLL